MFKRRILKTAFLSSLALLLGLSLFSGFSTVQAQTHNVLGEFGTTST
jgi:hypothetical protein